MKKLLFLISIVIAAFGIACKKQDVPLFSGKNGISFYKGPYDPDSLGYSFAFSLVEKQRDTIFIPMRITGPANHVARAIAVKAGDGTTAREGKDFILPEATLPADSLTVNYPVIVLNSPEMKNGTFRLVVQVAPSKDFELGALGKEIGGTTNVASMIINISAQLIRPSYWPAGGYGDFGLFSQVKFKFMMEATGLTNFDSDVIGIDQYYNLPVVLQRKLAEYEAINGPLVDEDGLRVTFN
ncbi:DUF4843 domain-containing protein [Chitinophaga eiseniae]|uniref:DUF4843 domain-containing protein n=1 Tax=Chitinophaga eiseniae TaxID=634771 RepID=A0A847S764_9BACT|nr:DUF4843 domain-containing protein [Chitinophaga eiseniae]NLR79090.1 DUF4843 domain-containing protein [Chitinophaga eiseniae]